MSRPIKFRVWHKEKKKFINPDWFYITAEGDVWGVLDLRDSWDEENITDDVELMQYTGLKDSEDRLIYEGDIIKIKNDFDWGEDEDLIGVVKYKVNDGFHYTAFDVDFVSDNKEEFYFDTNIFSTINMCNGYEVYVIGNIYENPEFLEVKS